jgi:tetratricopeptide (TPR) repeat protein
MRTPKRMNDGMVYDVFFSYQHADTTEVLRICKALRARGLSVWIDKKDILDFASITRSIVEGLAKSKVLLAYYSRNYSSSRACQWELTAAFLAAQREGNPRQRVLIINPEEDVEHIQPIELRDELFLNLLAPMNPENIDRAVSSVEKHVAGVTGIFGEIHAPTQPQWYGKKGIGSNRFVGRLPDMWHIHSFLHAIDYPIVTGATASAVVQICGMGGVGKSLLVEEYALRYAAAFPGGIFWLRAFGNDDAKTTMGTDEREAERIRQFRDVATHLDIAVQNIKPEEIEGYLARELAKREKSFLWVVDDLPSGMHVETLQKWLAPHPLGRTLITTRTHEHSAFGNTISLKDLKPDEAYELLTCRRKPVGKKEEDAAQELVMDDLGCHALAVEVAGAALYASDGVQSFADFRNALANPGEDELELAKELIGTLPNGHEKSIASTLLRSIELLEDEGRDFLRLASVLAVAPIPASLVLSVFCEVDRLDETKGRRRAVLAMDQAEKLSLAKRAEEEQELRSVHTLVSRTMRFRDAVSERSSQLQDAAVRVLTAELSRIVDPRTHVELKLAVTHAWELLSRADDLAAAKLMGWVAQYDQILAAYGSAENLYRRQWEIRKDILGIKDPETLVAMGNLATTLKARGNLEGAREIQEEVLEILQQVRGPEHPDTFIAMNNLAETLMAQGELDEACKIQENILKTVQEKKLELRRHEPNFFNILKFWSNRALMHQDQGDLDRAREIQENVLELRQQILGPEHPDTLTAMHNFAGTLLVQGDMDSAREIQENVLELSRQERGAEHPHTSAAAWSLFSTLDKIGDIDAAGTVLVDDLLWLLDRDPASLGADQRQIREMIVQMNEASDNRNKVK